METLVHNGIKIGTIQNNYLLFWDGIFSQWYPSEFTINKIQFNCAEQYMMYNKAMLFNDTVSAIKIMSANSPHKQKKLGKLVKNFDSSIWDANAKNIVYAGNFAKFTQNDTLLDGLKKTNQLILVEASPYDKIWGIGLFETDPLAGNCETWQGKNWLGEVLTKLKFNLIK